MKTMNMVRKIVRNRGFQSNDKENRDDVRGKGGKTKGKKILWS